MMKRLAVFVFVCGLWGPAISQTQPVKVPDWALPGSATHTQVPPPAGFHRATRTKLIPLGILKGRAMSGVRWYLDVPATIGGRVPIRSSRPDIIFGISAMSSGIAGRRCRGICLSRRMCASLIRRDTMTGKQSWPCAKAWMTMPGRR